jgi:hypothetical protein
VRPTTAVPQSIHQQAIIQQTSTTPKHLRDISMAPALAPTVVLLATLACIHRAISASKHHPPIHRLIHYTPRVVPILEQLQPMQQAHTQSTQSYIETISIHPPRCPRKAMRIRHSMYPQLIPLQEAFLKIGILMHPHIHRLRILEARRQACNRRRSVFLEHPQTLAFLRQQLTISGLASLHKQLTITGLASLHKQLTITGLAPLHKQLTVTGHRKACRLALESSTAQLQIQQPLLHIRIAQCPDNPCQPIPTQYRR